MTQRTQPFADPITRIDLELESRADQVATVFGAFVRPHTAEGAAELRKHLAEPGTTRLEIQRMQGAVRDCVETIGPFTRCVEKARPERVLRYLHSQMDVPRVTPGFGGRLVSAWTAVRHGECVAIAREGRECLTALAASCREWLALSRATHRSERLQECGRRLEVDVTAIEQGLGNRGIGAADLLAIDARFRGDGRTVIESALRVLGAFDALHALAATGRANGWNFPALRDGPPHLVIEGLRHPLVATPVENDAHLAGDRRLLLLTGPNMAGKTTYMKSLGIAVYLAQMGMAVPARAMELAPFDRLITVIGIHDSVASGSSAFHYEVTRLDHGLEALLAGRRCLLLFDELMRGTNAADAEEACRLVIAALARSGNFCAVMATHLAGLVETFAQEPRLTLGHFAAEVKDDALAYDFRLRPGSYTGRMAMALLEQMGVTAKLARLRADASTPEAGARSSAGLHDDGDVRSYQPALPPSGSGPTE